MAENQTTEELKKSGQICESCGTFLSDTPVGHVQLCESCQGGDLQKREQEDPTTELRK